MSVEIDYTSGAFVANKVQSVGTIVDSGTANYNIGVAFYDGVSFSVSGQETSPAGIDFKPDGTKMYIVGFSTDSVYQYSLSTAFDISTASYDSVSLSVAGQDTNPYKAKFNTDGTRLYVLGATGDRVYQYSLSTAYDLSTASYDSVSFSVSSQDITPLGLFFKPDGTKMYMVGAATDTVYQYSLSTAYNLSTASYDSVSFSVATQETVPHDIAFSSSGESMYILGTAGDDVNEYYLSTAWDVSSASYVRKFSVSSQDLIPTGLAFNSDGSKMYIVGNTNDTIFQYSTSAARKIIDISSGQNFEYTPTADTTFGFSNPPASGTAAGLVLALTGANAVNGYDVVNMSVFSGTDQFDAQGPSNLEQDVLIRDNGTDLFILDFYGIIWHYSLATPFNVNSTATLVRSLDVKNATGTGVGSASDFRGFTISPDGTQVVVRCDDPSISLRQFSLATPWDLSSTKTVVGSYTGLSGVSGANDARGVKFANNGTLVTVGGQNVQRRFAILELSSPYNISSVSSTTTYDLNTDFGYTTRTNYWVWGSQYSNDGKKLIITSTYGYEIVVVDLQIPYDPSSYTGFSELQYGGVANIASLAFTSDGAKAVSVRNTTTEDIRSYTTGTSSPATFTYPTSVDWPSAAPAAPGVGETDVLVFYTDDGGATYKGFKAGDAMS